MAQKKMWKELDLSNVILFAAALEDEKICRLVIELILGYPVEPVKVRTERSILFSSDFRSVRLDVYAREETRVEYNLEMQNHDFGNLPKRCRYHQAELDVASLKPGEDFRDLKPSFIIFICTFDPFGYSRYRYIFEERCLEEDIPLGDETRKIFLNTKGKNEQEVPSELVHFLRYVENSSDGLVEQLEDMMVGKLHNMVTELKNSRELEDRYMLMEEILAYDREEEYIRGCQEGQESTLNLVLAMTLDGRSQDISRLREEHGFLEKMLKHYQIKL